MDDKKAKKRSLSLGDIIFTSLMLVAFGVKFYVFYSQLHLGGFELCFTLASLAFLMVLYSLVCLISHKAARVVLTVLYFVSSVVMGIDGVYYAYVSKLPSAVQAGMAWQLGDVVDAIADLIKFRHVLNLIDLPLWLIWLIDRSLIKKKNPTAAEAVSRPRVNRFVVSAALVALAGLFVAFNFLVRDFRPEYYENELYYYHFSDVYKSFFAPPEEKDVDKTVYEAPAPVESEYYGLAEGRNIFIIQVEAMQNFLIGAEYEGQELTPTLNALIGNDSFYFKNYYYQIGGGNTCDAEFAVNNSLFAPESEAAYVKFTTNDYYGLPFLVKDNGYSGAYAFHGYDGIFWNREAAYPYQGFDDYTSLEDFDATSNIDEVDSPFGMGISDREFFRQSLEKIKTYEEPFYSFMITLSSHYPFALPMKARHISLKPDDEATLFGLYIQSINYFDGALGEFIENLKAAGLYDNSIIVIYGDHYALTNTDPAISTRVEAMLGRDYTIFDVFNVPCIIHIPSMGKSETIDTAGGHVDLLPTLLCLLGIENDKAVMFGQNLFEAEHGFVCEQTHMARGSFISDEVLLKKPYNNIKTNYDAYEYGTMARLDPESFEEQSAVAADRIDDCMVLLAENRILLDSDESTDSDGEDDDN